MNETKVLPVFMVIGFAISDPNQVKQAVHPLTITIPAENATAAVKLFMAECHQRWPGSASVTKGVLEVKEPEVIPQ